MSYPSGPQQPPTYGPAPYGPQYGGPQYGAPQFGAPQFGAPYPPWQVPYGPGFGYPPRPSTAPAYVAAVLFIACGALSLVLAILGWSGGADPHVLAGLVGIISSSHLTGNADFAISATMTAACTTLTFALVLLARLTAVRWFLVVLGAVLAGYYLVAVFYLMAHHAASVTALPAAAFLLWLCATVVAALPATGRAMRRHRRPAYR
jgi:hypothetical protein